MVAAIGIAIAAFLLKWPTFAQPLTAYFGSYQAINGMMAEMMGAGSITDFFIPKPRFHFQIGLIMPVSFPIYSERWENKKCSVF